MFEASEKKGMSIATLISLSLYMFLGNNKGKKKRYKKGSVSFVRNAFYSMFLSQIQLFTIFIKLHYQY